VEAQPSGSASRTQIILAFVAVYIIWGSTYLAIRFALETLPPFLMAGVRFVVAGGILFGYQIARNPQRTTFAQWRAALIIGALLIGVANGAVVWSELHIPSGIAAILAAIMPCWMVLLDWLWLGSKRPSLYTTFGLLLGFGGLALLMLPGLRGTAGSIDLRGIAAISFGSICWAVGSTYSKRAPLPKPQGFATAMEMLCGGATLLIVGLVTGEARGFDLHAISARSLIAVTYLMIFGSLIAFSAYVWLLHKVSAAAVSTYAYINPLVAMLLGWALAGEAFTPTMAAASMLIVAGVFVTTVSSRTSADSEEPASRKPEPSLVAIPDRQ
jgi:drug/metabolite transporter (DMT)-like permease